MNFFKNYLISDFKKVIYSIDNRIDINLFSEENQKKIRNKFLFFFIIIFVFILLLILFQRFQYLFFQIKFNSSIEVIVAITMSLIVTWYIIKVNLIGFTRLYNETYRLYNEDKSLPYEIKVNGEIFVFNLQEILCIMFFLQKENIVEYKINFKNEKSNFGKKKDYNPNYEELIKLNNPLITNTEKFFRKFTENKDFHLDKISSIRPKLTETSIKCLKKNTFKFLEYDEENDNAIIMRIVGFFELLNFKTAALEVFKFYKN